jgi:NADPH2:quinone reductase
MLPATPSEDPMVETPPQTALALRSTVSEAGTLELTLENLPVPPPKEHEIVVRVEAAPVNPSDLGTLLAGADITTAKQTGSADAPRITAEIPSRFMGGLKARVGKGMPAGNEGAGIVVAAGEKVQNLLGKRVALSNGAMYAEYSVAPAAFALPLPEGTTPAEGASCFVNPLTAQGMIETMRLEGHSALVHTAAASNLGQMLVKLCLADGVPLVNIVRKPAQEDLLRKLGAEHVCNSSAPSFLDDLTNALAATGATLGFDATGGGALAGQILTCMERALVRNAESFSNYGSDTHKQVYIYGGLEKSPTRFERSFGMAWGMGGWLLTPFLQKLEPAVSGRLFGRVAKELKTTFASHYTQEVSLKQLLDVDTLVACGRQATGEKLLVRPDAG